MTLAAATMTSAHPALTTAQATVTTAATETHGFLSPTGVEIAFLLVGLVTFGAAIVTVTTRQLVHAALWLVVALGGIAVEYLLLTAEFIAWVQVLIYVGSVVVLLLFGLMLTKAPIGRSPDADSGNRWAALTVAVASAAALVWVVVDAFRTTWIDLDGPAAGSTEATGASLFQNWVLPFEALSVLLLAALVGAIVLSRKAKAESSSPLVNSRPATGSSPSAPNSRNHPIRRNGQDAGTRPTERGTTTEPNTPAEPSTPAEQEGAALMHLAYPAVLSALLFCTGLYGVLARRNAILVLMSVELMLNAVNLNLVAFDVWLSRTAEETLHSGQALTLFTIAIAAAEIGIGLAIVLAVHRNRGTSDIDKLRDTAEGHDPDDGDQGDHADDSDAPAAEKAEATA
jgi:NADH-quinone oxidoreductase subunit J